MTERLPDEPHLLTDLYSWQTSDELLDQFGVEALANIRARLSREHTEAEAVVAEAKRALHLAIESAKDIRANIDAVAKAERQGRDLGLE